VRIEEAEVLAGCGVVVRRVPTLGSERQAAEEDVRMAVDRAQGLRTVAGRRSLRQRMGRKQIAPPG
jgi:hypothetical protein